MLMFGLGLQFSLISFSKTAIKLNVGQIFIKQNDNQIKDKL